MLALKDIEDEAADNGQDKELKQLSLYQKLVVQGSPTNKAAKKALEESKVSTIPEGLQGMVKEMKPTYERKQMVAILDSLR